MGFAWISVHKPGIRWISGVPANARTTHPLRFPTQPIRSVFLTRYIAHGLMTAAQVQQRQDEALEAVTGVSLINMKSLSDLHYERSIIVIYGKPVILNIIMIYGKPVHHE